MKIQVRITTKYGVYDSDISELTAKEFDNLKTLACKINNLEYFTIVHDNITLFFAPNVVKDSIISFIEIK